MHAPLSILATPLPERHNPHGKNKLRRRLFRWLERLLFAGAAVSLGYYGVVTLETHFYQVYEDRQLDEILNSRATMSVPSAPLSVPSIVPHSSPRPRPAAGSTIGRIEIPRLGVSAVVRAGDDARTLQLAVGYIPGTALPGEAGNVGLAAHRDTFFRQLREIQLDDQIRIATPDGVYRYRVERTVIVNPQDVWVLDPTDHPTLTLVTCYPFTYIGSAPQRFIVRAALMEDPAPVTQAGL